MVTLGEVLAFILRLLGITLTIDSVLGVLSKFLMAPTAPANPSWWMADIKQLDDLFAYGGANYHPTSGSVAAILDNLNAMALDYQQRGHDVTLPSTPPSGYGGASVDDVWHAGPFVPSDVDTGTTIGQCLIALRNLVGNGGMVRMQGSRHTYISDALFSAIDEFGFSQVVHDDLSAALPGDTPLSFLLRENPTQGWTANFHGWTELNPFAAGNVRNLYLINDITQEDIDAALLALSGGGAAAATAPVWPGLANVTLGTPVAIAVGVTVPGPLHGVVINATGLSGLTFGWDFDGTVSLRGLGAITFVSDDDDFEEPQLLGFPQAVYTPHAMASASSAVLRVAPGISGTVTPWLRS